MKWLDCDPGFLFTPHTFHLSGPYPPTAACLPLCACGLVCERCAGSSWQRAAATLLRVQQCCPSRPWGDGLEGPMPAPQRLISVPPLPPAPLSQTSKRRCRRG